MKSIIIISLTEVGKNALEIHYRESDKLNPINKLRMKILGLKQKIICKEPYTLELEITNEYLQKTLRQDDFIKEIEKGLILNGAGINIDYEVKINE